MVKMTMKYTGEKHCQAQHEPSQSLIETDAPKDNNGRGEKFSPTDLMGTALGTCMLTTVAIFAERDGVQVTGAKATVTKEMASDPRRVFRLKTILEYPKSVPEEYRAKIIKIANNCPVKISLHPDIEAPVEISFSL